MDATHRFIWMLLAALALANAAHAASTPEDVLKSKGLTKVGAFYLLDGDIKFQEKLRLLRAA